MRPAIRPTLVLLLVAASAVPAAGETKRDEQALLVPVANAHCLAFYDAVELRLKGRGDDLASITTRNGLKDFFVVRPGVVDCAGQREIPWRDDKDREFILSVLKDPSIKVDMASEYGIAPAPSPTKPRL